MIMNTKDFLTKRQENFNAFTSNHSIEKEVYLHKEVLSLRKRKNKVDQIIMNKRIINQTSLSFSSIITTAITPITTITIPQNKDHELSSYITQKYNTCLNRLEFISLLLHSNPICLDLPQQAIDESVLISTGVTILKDYLTNHNLILKETKIFYEQIFYRLIELFNKSLDIQIKADVIIILSNLTLDDKSYKKYSFALCDKTFLININEYFSLNANEIDKRLLCNLILLISNIMAENAKNYASVLRHVFFIPFLETILNTVINKSSIKFIDMNKDDRLIFDNSLYLLYNFFFYMQSNDICNFTQFIYLTINSLHKAYNESHMEFLLLSLDILEQITCKGLKEGSNHFVYNHNKNKNIIMIDNNINKPLIEILFSIIQISLSIQITFIAMKIIHNIFKFGSKPIKDIIIEKGIANILMKNITECNNNNEIIQISLKILTQILSKKKVLHSFSFIFNIGFIHKLNVIFSKYSLRCKAEVVKCLAIIIMKDTMNNDNLNMFYNSELWTVIVEWFVKNWEMYRLHKLLVNEILKLFDKMLNHYIPYEKDNIIKIYLENKGLNMAFDTLGNCNSDEIQFHAKTIYFNFWGEEENYYCFKENVDMKH